MTVRLFGSGVDFLLPARWPAPPADAVVRRATSTYRHLRSITYVERLASRPGNTVISHWLEAAPDRLQYTIPHGPAGIVIGAQRWDRSGPSARWVHSVTQPLDVPSPIWESSRPTNAHLLGMTTIDSRRVVVVSLLDRSLPAWFTIRFDAHTLHPVSLDMTAAAHFMHHDFLSFNRPVPIRPPRGRGAAR